MKERFGIVLLAALSLSACNEQNDTSGNSVDNSSYTQRSYSVLAQMRPKADPNVMKQMHDEDESARQARIAEAERIAKEQQAQQQQQQQPRDLPGVNNSPISGNIQPVNGWGGDTSSQQQAQQTQQNQSWAVPSAPPPPAAASYGINYTQPSPGFVPPPPAVSLSTSAVPMYGTPPPDYANPYANPYGGYQQQQAPVQPTRAPGSMFGAATSGASKPNNSDDDEPKKKKVAPIQIITPTGMEARSPYKQRDELRMLWKGAVATCLANVNSDPKLAESLSKVDVVLPSEASKGSLSVAQRTVDYLFKNAALDKRIVVPVKKVETDLVQAYYRYLYAYNKFYLTQQQVAARKQELDCADSQAEKQRATVDLANSQQEADASKDDMRSSQGDLAAIVGTSAARTVIKNVSGVSPSLEAIAVDSQPQAQDKGGEGGIGGLLNVFGFGKGKSKDAQPDADAPQVASEVKGKEKKEKAKDKDKEKDKKKDKGAKQQIAAKPQDAASTPKTDAAEQVAPPPAASQNAVSFELKNVKTTPRKSILSVVVRNGGGDNFSFNADSISVAEGSSKLADAAVNAEFDSTVVQPSQEVTGTITIFGRPWNDKLTVSLSDGSKPILLRR